MRHSFLNIDWKLSRNIAKIIDMRKIVAALWRGAWIGLSIGAVVVVSGCVSPGSSGVDRRGTGSADAASTIADVPLDNRIRVNGHGFALPSGWMYGPGIGEGVPFTFRWSDSSGGQLEVVHWDPAFSYERFSDHFRGRVFPGDRDPRKEIMYSERLGDVLVLTGDSDDRSFVSLLARDGERVLLLHVGIVSPDEIPPGLLLRILETYDYSPELRDFRRASGRIGFAAMDDAWRWSADVNDGVYVRRSGDSRPLTVGFWSADASVTGEFESDFAEVSPPVVLPHLHSGTGPVRVFTREGTRLDEYVLVFRGQRDAAETERVLIMRVAHPRSDAETAGTTLSDPLLQDLIDFSLVLPPTEITP